MEDSLIEERVPAPGVLQQPSPSPSPPESRTAGSTDTHIAEQQESKRMDMDEEVSAPDMLSPMSAEADKQQDESDLHQLTRSDLSSPSMGYDFSNIRVGSLTRDRNCDVAGTDYFLAHTFFPIILPARRQQVQGNPAIGALRIRCAGRNQARRHARVVSLRIPTNSRYAMINDTSVSWNGFGLCFVLTGLTDEHPTLTTYFEGEIIGSKYTFLTQHQDWGSTDKVDLQHWAKFSAFRPFQKQARKGNFHIPVVAQRENIFMRWKEHFLVPDHRVRTITGASFEGFYYICFNQIQGTVSGIYFHAKSEK
jgi:hypothetical protein